MVLLQKKIEGDKKTPIGTFKIQHLYYRKDRINLPHYKIKMSYKLNQKWVGAMM